MKRTLLVVSLCLIASFSFAQKKAVKDAKAAMKNNVTEARELIDGALKHPETMNLSDTWKVAGDIEYSLFDEEFKKEQLKEVTKKPGNEKLMYEGLYNMYAPYIQADKLGELPDEKGKIKNKVRKDIVRVFKETYPFLINGGVYFNDKHNFKKAADLFERYWTLSDLPLFEGETVGVRDSTYQSIKYYAIVCVMQDKDNERAIKMLERINSEPYIQNSTYKESDTYELLADQYQQVGDSINFLKVLQQGAQKFPKNQYFTPNLINVFIKNGKTQEAIDYINQSIANDPSSACDLYSVKASLFADTKDYKQAVEIYNDALAIDAACVRALEGIGVLYIVQAQDIREAASNASRKRAVELDEQAKELYIKALEPLESLRSILKADPATDEITMKQIYVKLQNVYYNLTNLNVDKSKEFEEIDALLNVE